MNHNPTLILSYTCGGLVVLYVLLVGFTMYFASVETHVSSSMRDIEASVSSLEAEYYQAIAAVSERDPYLIGFANPTRVLYVTSGAEGLSLVQTPVKP